MPGANRGRKGTGVKALLPSTAFRLGSVVPVGGTDRLSVLVFSCSRSNLRPAASLVLTVVHTNELLGKRNNTDLKSY